MSEPARDDDGSVTVVTSRLVKPGREADFEVWLEGIGAVAARYPGYVWRRVTREARAGATEFVTVFKFDSIEHLRGWTASAERHAWLERVKPLVLDDFRETVLTGLERWFTLPTLPGVPPPPRYKMATVTLIVVYPISLALGPLVGFCLRPLPAPVRSLAQAIAMVALLTYVIMPRATRLFQRWLYPR